MSTPFKIDQIIVAKETREGEARVALTPTTVSSLIEKHYRVLIESEAGILEICKFRDSKKTGLSVTQRNRATGYLYDDDVGARGGRSVYSPNNLQ